MKRIIFYWLLSLFMLSSVSAALIDNQEGYYSFRTDLTDITGNGNDLANTGTTNITGFIDNARDFDGNDYVFDSTPATYPEGNANYTYSQWVYNPAVTTTRVIVSNGDIDTGSEVQSLYFTNGNVNFLSSNTHTIAQSLPVNTWTHVAVTYNASSLVSTIYFDGSNISSFTHSGSVNIDHTNGGYYVGAFDNAANAWLGRIDEVGVWDRELSSTEMAQLYNSGAGFQYPYVGTPQIQTNLTNYETINTNNITGSATTQGTVNMTFYQNGVQIGQVNNTNGSSYDLVNLVLGLNNISLLSENVNGSVWTNFTLEFQPIQYFSFNNTQTGLLITNYTLNGETTLGTTIGLDTSTLTYGNASVIFSKPDFGVANFTFSLNFTDQLNETFNISPSAIQVYIFDRVTENLITDSVQITLVGGLGDNASTTSGNHNFSNINRPSGDYQIIAASADYETESVYFTYTDQNVIIQNIYLLSSNDSNLGDIEIVVKDDFSQFIENAVVNLLEWKSALNAFETVAQCSTNALGACNLNIELNNKLYKFQAVKAGVTTTTNSQIITTTGTSLTIILSQGETTIAPALENLVYNFTETIANNISTARFQWTQTEGLLTEACINVYEVSTWSTQLLTQNCTTTSSGILFINQAINNTFTTKISAEVISEGITYELKSFIHKSIEDISFILKENNLDIFLPAVLGMLAIGTGIFLGNMYISVLLLILSSWLSFVIVPTILSSSIAVVITVLGILTLYGGIKR